MNPEPMTFSRLCIGAVCWLVFGPAGVLLCALGCLQLIGGELIGIALAGAGAGLLAMVGEETL